MSTEKKFFSVNKVEYTIVTGARWYVEYYVQHPTGVRERKRAYGQINRIKDLEEREAAAITLIKSISSGINIGEKSILLKTLQQYRPLLRLKTYQTYKSRVDCFNEWLNGRDDATVTTEIANEFLFNLLSTGRQVGTLLSYRRTLGTLYTKWNKKFNPFSEAIAPKKQATSLMYYNDAQAMRIKEHVMQHKPTLWVAIQMLFYCFIRPQEMRLLTVDNIYLSESFIHIPAHVSKNKKDQKVSIPSHFVEPLREYISDKTGWLFSWKKKRDKPVGINWFNAQHIPVLKALEIRGNYAFYSWKHTGVVRAKRAGIDLKDLQLQLRHHSLDMVNEYLKNLGVMDSEDLKKKFPVL